MESEIDKKRNIFRASLRREYIEAYQKKIRMKYMQLERAQDKRNQIQTGEQIIANLEAILLLSSEQICSIDNYEYLMECMQIIANYENQSESKSSRGAFQSKNKMSYFKLSNSFMEQKSPQKKMKKQKISSLLFKIVEKSFNQCEGRLKFVLDKIFYLLQFPDLMPLWEKLSLTYEKSIKQQCSNRFSLVLIGQNNLNIAENFQTNILDPDFSLDILVNFFTQSPEISFDLCLQFFPYISFCLRDERLKEGSLSKLDKVCFVLRSLFKEDGKERVKKLIQQGFQSILIGFMTILSGSSLQEEKNSYLNECHYTGSIDFAHKQSQHSLISTKKNILKMLSRIFVVNTEAALYLYQKCAECVFSGLFKQVQLNKEVFCRGNLFGNEREHEKYKYIILCDSHGSLMKQILLTISTILMASRPSLRELRNPCGEKIIQDFLRLRGLQFLEMVLSNKKIFEQFKIEIVNVFSVLDNSNYFYSLLTVQQFDIFNETLLQTFLISMKTQGMEGNFGAEDPNSQIKILKTVKNSLLRAYSRATDPLIYENFSAKILFREKVKKVFIYLIQISEQSDIESNFSSPISIQSPEISHSFSGSRKNLAIQILEICEDPKSFFESRQSKASQMRMNQTQRQRISYI